MVVGMLCSSAVVASDSFNDIRDRNCNDGDNMDGCVKLGNEYFSEQNYVRASKLYKTACDGGGMSGCHNLALLYGQGKGVRQNYSKANELRKTACDGGSMPSCFNLGEAYEQGTGVRQDKSKAKSLYGVACDGENQNGCDAYRVLNEQGVR